MNCFGPVYKKTFLICILRWVLQLKYIFDHCNDQKWILTLIHISNLDLCGDLKKDTA